MTFKKLFKPTKKKIFFMLSLFLMLGFLKIFTLQNAITGEVYRNSLFQQYQFQYQHSNDDWYNQNNKYFWSYYLFLHIAVSYIVICISTFIVNRLRGEDNGMVI